MKLHAIYAGVVVVVILLALAGAWQWGEHVRYRAQLEQSIQDHEKRAKELEQQNAQLTATIRDVREQAAAAIADLEKQRAQAKASPEQAIRIVHDVLPTATVSQVPDAPSSLSKADTQKLADFQLTCAECDTNLRAAREEISADETKVTNLEGERDQLKKDLETSQKSHRRGFWRTLGCSIAGMAGAGLGTAVGKTDGGKAKGAAIGAGAGILLCELTH